MHCETHQLITRTLIRKLFHFDLQKASKSTTSIAVEAILQVACRHYK